MVVLAAWCHVIAGPLCALVSGKRWMPAAKIIWRCWYIHVPIPGMNDYVILRGLKKSVREECGWEGYKRNRSIQCRRCAAFTRAKGASEWSGIGPLCNAMHNFMVKMKKGKKEEERRRKGGKKVWSSVTYWFRITHRNLSTAMPGT